MDEAIIAILLILSLFVKVINLKRCLPHRYLRSNIVFDLIYRASIVHTIYVAGLIRLAVLWTGDSITVDDMAVI